MNILYSDNRILVCEKPFGVCSTDEPGGVPSLLREQLGEPDGCVRTVHRLDSVVGGAMVLARSKEASRRLSACVQNRRFHKTYLAVVHGTPKPEGAFTDLLLRNKQERKTYITAEPGKDVQEAKLRYKVLATKDGLSLVEIELLTGRTHQIRCQFSGHGFPIVGDKKYGAPPLRENEIALWSYCLRFPHPQTEEEVSFTCPPPQTAPWDLFSIHNQ